ncbi:hypothetical protein [Natronolimnobius baerhuensis]|uniref:Uncharacterized protein n=1 Tax=Natronolimnobius baerhuensis TaxID=253108 RepID=A0A202EAX4_9EURY|nr:hypothetical protein [Natronolimnobius baerhuensis]OVE85384.1 hypothetical protein B2G88_00705 [Natronolimnobius baerhuensis]
MATHGSRNGATGGSRPTLLALDLPQFSRLSWELGARLLDDDATCHSKWERTGSTWRLSIFRVETNTAVVRVQTPVGRERFYTIAELDLEAVIPELEAAAHWQRV